MTLGTLKDTLATLTFIVLLGLVYYKDLHLNKSLILGLLIVALLVDGMFTIYPQLHCMKIDSFQKFQVSF